MRSAALILGFFAAVSIVRANSATFHLYMNLFIGQRMLMPPFVSWILLACCIATYLFSVAKSKGRQTYNVWQRADASLLAVLTFCTVLLCVYFAKNTYSSFFSMMAYLFLLSAIAYAAVMIWLGEIAARIRDGRLIETLYWLAFFRQYPIPQPIGLLMGLLLVGNLLYIASCALKVALDPSWYMQAVEVITDTTHTYSYDYPFSIPWFLLSVFTLAALTYCCAFVLSLSAQYEQANAAAIRSERFKAELITNVSHDIRSPLTSIINYVDLLKALPIEHDAFVEYTDILDKKSARLKTLISDLLEASKASAGTVNMDIHEIDLAEIAGQIAGDVDAQFAERKLTLVMHEPEQPVSIRADSNHLRRVLENIFDNAAKYALPGTRVFVDITSNNGISALSLKNTSESPIDLTGDGLTEQFIRGDRSRQSEGSGLGLYIAKSLVELMGGHFSVRVMGDLFEVELSFR